MSTKIKIFLACLLLCQIAFAQNKSLQITKYVNPFIGTGGHGHTYPGPALPFSMIQPGPDTRLNGWDGCSGYHFSDNVVYGFSQTHLSGTGIEDYCDFLFMPTTGKPEFSNQLYSSPFQKKNEKASPGYYHTILDKYKIKTEITATQRAGLYRFTYPKTNEANLIIDLSHRDKTLESWVEIVGDREIRGYRKSSAWAKGQELYFCVRFNKAFNSYGFEDGEKSNGLKKKKINGGIKLYVRFDTRSQDAILAQVSISPVDAQGAVKNLNAEKYGFNFAQTFAVAQDTWNKQLSKIEVTDENPKKLTTFYTALYHALLNPNLYMDVDRRYRGLDNQIHTAKDFDYYSVFSLWDTYRTENPLLTLIDRKRTLDFIKTFLAMYEQSGQLPIWPLANEETFCMIGNHAIPVITDAYAKGIRNFDTKLALKAMKKSVNRLQFGIADYAKMGAVMADMEHESASKTVEYAYDDWCIAQFANMTNQQEDYMYYLSRAQNWKNVYDPESKHIRARNNGGWWKPFNPTEVNNNYTEGNSWHYSFSTQQDINTHIEFMGGEPLFQQKLDELFTTSLGLTGRDQSDITGLIGQYAHGNEPSHHMAYLFNFTNHPEKTQFYVNKIMNEQYHDQPDGLSGNEDCGQMSAWLVMSAMGIYPVSPGNNMYNFGTPWFKKMTISLENGKKINISAPSKNRANFYIEGITLNAKPYEKLFIDFSDLSNGANLNFKLVSKPNMGFLNSLMKPVMKIDKNLIVPNPIIEGPQETFKDQATIRLSCALSDAVIYYTIDGSMPNEKSTIYQQPFIISKGTTINAVAMKKGLQTSYVSTATYVKIENNYSIQINSEINKSFTAGGNDGLIDGVRGTLNWRVSNRWQGFWGKDFEAILDLGKLMSVEKVSIGALQDTQAWIVFPPETEFLIAADDKKFKSVAIIKAPAEANNYKVQIAEISTKIGAECRYIMIRAKNYGTLPSWHEGVGGKAHSFFDEITVN